MAKKHRGRTKRSFGLKLKKNTLYSVVQVVFFSLAALVVLSFLRRGIVLIYLNDLLLSYFAWTTIFIPFIFLSFGFLVSKWRNPLAQPNVLVGISVFFVSATILFKSGIVGAASWENIVGLVTPVGAFIILFGTMVVGLVILFNTSLDQVLGLVKDILVSLRRYVLGEKAINPKMQSLLPKKELRILGGQPAQNQNVQSGVSGKKEAFAPELVSNTPGEAKVWKYPPIDVLADTETGKADRGDIRGNAATIEQTLESFGITAHVVEVNQGPAVTQYAIEVALGTKLSKITSLERDLALALSAPTGTIRIEAPIPGRNLVGIELPNRSPEFVPLKKMLSSDSMSNNHSKLLVALGLDVSGKPIVADLGKMPHVVIAGQTGSGKSVAINTFLSSILFRASPSEVKFILVDPKRVELTGFNGIPHLLSPVIVEPDKVVSALRWVISEMDRRYKLFAQAGARNIDGYNEMSGFQALPYIVIIIDELADIMLYALAEVEDAITRIAQMSRATGIHMVLATQRPSVNIITGLIKANIPCRIAFAVASQVDSRVILDTQGAEKLLGRGDMLYLPPDQAKPIRIQGAFVADKEVGSLVSYLKNQGVAPQYTEEVTTMTKSGAAPVPGIAGDADELFRKAVEVVSQFDRASASLLQRRLSIGYARAARIIDQLEAAGVVGPSEGGKPREVLVQNAEAFLNSTAPQQ